MLETLELTHEQYRAWVASDDVKPHAEALLWHIDLVGDREEVPEGGWRLNPIHDQIMAHGWHKEPLDHEEDWTVFFCYALDDDLVDDDIDYYCRFVAHIAKNIRKNIGKPGNPLNDEKYRPHIYYTHKVAWHFWLRLRETIVKKPKSSTSLEKQLLGWKWSE